jgi:hypothetical protein
MRASQPRIGRTCKGRQANVSARGAGVSLPLNGQGGVSVRRGWVRTQEARARRRDRRLLAPGFRFSSCPARRRHGGPCGGSELSARLVHQARNLASCRSARSRWRRLKTRPLAAPFHAGGGTRTPDTRIMISRFSAYEVIICRAFIGGGPLGGHVGGHVCQSRCRGDPSGALHAAEGHRHTQPAFCPNGI